MTERFFKRDPWPVAREESPINRGTPFEPIAIDEPAPRGGPAPSLVGILASLSPPSERLEPTSEFFVRLARRKRAKQATRAAAAESERDRMGLLEALAFDERNRRRAQRSPGHQRLPGAANLDRDQPALEWLRGLGISEFAGLARSNPKLHRAALAWKFPHTYGDSE